MDEAREDRLDRLLREVAEKAEAAEADQTDRPFPPGTKVSRPNRASGKASGEGVSLDAPGNATPGDQQTGY